MASVRLYGGYSSCAWPRLEWWGKEQEQEQEEEEEEEDEEEGEKKRWDEVENFWRAE